MSFPLKIEVWAKRRVGQTRNGRGWSMACPWVMRLGSLYKEMPTEAHLAIEIANLSLLCKSAVRLVSSQSTLCFGCALFFCVDLGAELPSRSTAATLTNQTRISDGSFNFKPVNGCFKYIPGTFTLRCS